nr:MAG TPA: hypothetical protein [Caudoviricetes sp.]
MFGYGYQPGFGGYYGAAPDQLAQMRMGQNQPMQMQQQGQQQNGGGLVWVQGEAGMKSYPVANGQTVILMDSENPVFYIKSCDMAGMPSARTFDYKERKVPVTQGKPTEEYVTRKDFEALQNRVEELVKRPARAKKEAATDEPTV